MPLIYMVIFLPYICGKGDWLIIISEWFCVKYTFDFWLFIICHLLASIHSATGYSLELPGDFLSLRGFCVCKDVKVWQYLHCFFYFIFIFDATGVPILALPRIAHFHWAPTTPSLWPSVSSFSIPLPLIPLLNKADCRLCQAFHKVWRVKYLHCKMQTS